MAKLDEMKTQLEQMVERLKVLRNYAGNPLWATYTEANKQSLHAEERQLTEDHRILSKQIYLIQQS